MIVYNDVPYIIRDGRGSIIDANLIPNGKILTFGGDLVPIPPTLTELPQNDSVKKGTDQIFLRGRVTEPVASGRGATSKGTDQQVIIGRNRAEGSQKVTGSGTTPRK